MTKKEIKQKSIAEKLGIEQIEFALPEAGFVEQKSDKALRKKQVQEQIFGIRQEDNISKRQRVIKNILTIVFIVFVLSVLAYTAYKDFFAPDRDFPSWEKLGEILKGSTVYLLFALTALFFGYLFKALKLSIMTKALTKKFHFKTCFETAIIGSYYNTVTPLATGGQTFEIHHLSKHGVDSGVAYSAPIAAFLLNQLAFVALGITFLVFFQNNFFHLPVAIYGIFPNTVKVLAIIGLACCTIMPLLVVMFSLTPKLGAMVVKFVVSFLGKLRLVKSPEKTTAKTIKHVVHNAECLRKIVRTPLAFITSFILSFLEHFATVSLTFFVLKAFGYQAWYNYGGIYSPMPDYLMWLQAAQVTIILFASIAFIPTPGNSGAADLSFFLFFDAGLSAGLAFPATVLWRLFSFYSYIIIGFTFATSKKRADKKKALKEQENSSPKQLEMDLEFEQPPHKNKKQ